MLKRQTIELLSLALPIMIETVLQTLLGTTDTYFAGQLTDAAISGISVTNVVMNIFISFFAAVSIGTTALVSRNYGKKDLMQTAHCMSQSILSGILLGIGVGLFSLLFHEPILRLSGADHLILSYARPYYLIVAVPCVFLCLQQVLSSCLRAVKDTKTPMYATGFANILNIVLDIFFIQLKFGVVGLALATTISRFVGMLILLYQLKSHNRQLPFEKSGFKPDRAVIQSLLQTGIPAGTEKLIMRVGQLVYNGMILSIGANAYVAHNIAGTIESYSYIPAMGFGLAVSSLVGISLGEKSPKKAMTSTWMAYLLSAVCMVFIGLIFYYFSLPLAALFTKTKEVQYLVADVLRIIAFFQPFSALVQVMTNALQGAGDTKFPMYATVLGIWGIRLGVGYLFAIPFQLGLSGVWYAYALDLTIRGILLLTRFLKGRWRSILI